LFAQPDTGTFLGLRDRLLIDLLFGTGLRLAEALGLKVGDVDLEAGRMRVIGKGGGEALVGLSPTLRREFRHFLRQRGVALEAHGLGGSCWLFPSEEGGRLTSRAVQKAFLRYGRAAGIQGVRCSPHTLRHTYAVFLWRQCHDLETVRRALRHSDVRTTQRYLESLGVDDVAEYVRDLSPLESMDLPPLAGRRMRGSVLSDRGRRGRES
jgi:site-specific recombinase XerD